ncbi:hypothetical protein [Nostoc sp. ChiSLP03a]|uniref:hypothetical protein n=1 Tax=Nostoc sp. ChiSLP03a TaxID=3075380 RepID=UPI002AD40C06|nr:hypothetical protein [Nostoc sp. ChiSLP03a]MDZ8211337.1 hypothetical protein [Nostoc sp. ChiSLP03a]
MKRNTALGLLAIAGLAIYHLSPLMTPKLVAVNEPTIFGIGFQYDQWGTRYSAITDCKRQGWIVKTDGNTLQYQEANDAPRLEILQQICSTEDLD